MLELGLEKGFISEEENSKLWPSCFILLLLKGGIC